MRVVLQDGKELISGRGEAGLPSPKFLGFAKGFGKLSDAGVGLPDGEEAGRGLPRNGPLDKGGRAMYAEGFGNLFGHSIASEEEVLGGSVEEREKLAGGKPGVSILRGGDVLFGANDVGERLTLLGAEAKEDRQLKGAGFPIEDSGGS